MDVVLVRWPDERDRREDLQRLGRPRLLVLGDGIDPPSTTDPLEDWIRLPADDADLAARIMSLQRRAEAVRALVPEVDADGVLRFGGDWVALSPLEVRLIEVMIGRFGMVVSRDALTRAGWPQGLTDRNTLDVHVLRLRRRVQPLNLVIRTVRSRGYVIEPALRL